MPRLQQDYYEILGVPQTASGQDISSAYRSLAVKYHPDTAHGQPSDAQQFKDATEAYDVLSDPEKRRRYDRTRQAEKGAPIVRSPHSVTHPFGVAGFLGEHGWIDWVRHFFGDYPFRETATHHRSPAHAQPKIIRSQLPVTADEARTGATVSINFSMREPCPQCSGSGRKETSVCRACQGDASLAYRESLPIALPRGVRDGTILRFRHEAESGQYDMELQIRVRPSW